MQAQGIFIQHFGFFPNKQKTCFTAWQMEVKTTLIRRFFFQMRSTIKDKRVPIEYEIKLKWS